MHFESFDDIKGFRFPIPTGSVKPPFIRRKVVLKNVQGEHLLFAVSLWNSTDYKAYLPDKSKAIGTNLSAKKVEYFREILTTAIVTNPSINELKTLENNEFESLARGYLMYNEGRAITYIEEFFLPDLKEYI